MLQLGRLWPRALALLLMALALGSGNSLKGREIRTRRVLFIGNSLTYVNDLPSIIEALAEASGQKRPFFRSVAFANFSLEDHWNRGDALHVIEWGGWDFVVLQQGPSGSPGGRKSLLTYTRLFAQEIRRAGGRPALYMVWPPLGGRRDFYQDFYKVIESYSLAAKDVEGLLFPAGQAWIEAWSRDLNLELYSSDLFHPSVMGSYLAALTIYEQLYDTSPVGLPAKLTLRSGTTIELTQGQARLLQEAAAEANKKMGKRDR